MFGLLIFVVKLITAPIWLPLKIRHEYREHFGRPHYHRHKPVGTRKRSSADTGWKLSMKKYRELANKSLEIAGDDSVAPNVRISACDTVIEITEKMLKVNQDPDFVGGLLQIRDTVIKARMELSKLGQVVSEEEN